MRRQATRRLVWLWLAVSVAAHIFALSLIPGLDTPRRCPVMLLLTLASVRAAESASAREAIAAAGHRVRVGFSLDSAGELLGVSVKSSAGVEALDAAALDAVRRAAPFGAFPSGLKLGSLKLSVTLEYVLN